MILRSIVLTGCVGLTALASGCGNSSAPMASVRVAAPVNHAPVVLKEGAVRKDENYLYGRVVVDGTTVGNSEVRVHAIDLERAKKIGNMLPTLAQEAKQVRTNKDGVFIFHDIAPGTYRIFLSFDAAKFKGKKAFPYSNAIESPLMARTGKGKSLFNIDVKLRQ